RLRRRSGRRWKGGCPCTFRLPSMKCPCHLRRLPSERVGDSLGSQGTAPLAATLVVIESDKEDFVSDSSANRGAEQPEVPASDDGVGAGPETWPGAAAAVGDETHDSGRASEGDAYSSPGYGQPDHRDQTYAPAANAAYSQPAYG